MKAGQYHRVLFVEHAREPKTRLIFLFANANNAHCGVLVTLLSIRPSIEGFGSTFQGLELRRLGSMDAARLGKENAR